MSMAAYSGISKLARYVAVAVVLNGPWFGGVVAVVVGLSSCGSSNGNGGEDNLPPHAVLIAPVETGIGVLSAFSAVPSEDEDGIITGYLFNFGDGSPATHTGKASVQHTYQETGVFEAGLTVTDDDGAETGVTLQVRVIENFQIPACSQALACPAGTACMCLFSEDCDVGSCEGNRCPGESGICYQQAENEPEKSN